MQWRNHAPSAHQVVNRSSTHAFSHIQPSRWDRDEPSSILQVNSQPANTQLSPTQRALVSHWLAMILPLNRSYGTRYRYGVLLIACSLVSPQATTSAKVRLRVWLACLAIRNHWNHNLDCIAPFAIVWLCIQNPTCGSHSSGKGKHGWIQSRNLLSAKIGIS